MGVMGSCSSVHTQTNISTDSHVIKAAPTAAARSRAPESDQWGTSIELAVDLGELSVQLTATAVTRKFFSF